MADAVRCGLIGYGRIGRMVADLIREGSPADLKLAAIAERAVGKWSGPETFFSDVTSLLAADVTALIIATPPDLHYSMAAEALKAGKDVWVEKPPAGSAEEARELACMAEAGGRVLFFAYHARYNPAVEEAHEFLRSTPIRAVHVRMKENVANFHRPGSWVYTEGVLRDSGINVFSVLCSLIQDTEALHVLSCVLSPGPGNTGPRKAKLGLTGRVNIDMDWEYPEAEVRVFDISTDRGPCAIDLSRGVFLADGAPHAWTNASPDLLRTEYRSMLSDWSQRLRSRRSFANDREMVLLDEAESKAVRTQNLV